MSELYERWHELSKRGGLDLAGCQMLADWKREADQLRAQLQQAKAREAELRAALEKWKLLAHFGAAPVDWRTGVSLKDLYEECIQAGEKALSSPTQPSRYREMGKVVKAAKDFPLELVEEIVDWYKIEAQEEPAGKHTNETLSGIYDAITVMTDALAAYDKGGEGATAHAK